MAILRGLFWVLLFGFCFVSSAWAGSSVNVPLDSRVYAALEKLESFGLIDSALAGTKPYSRLEAARLVGEAMSRWRQTADQGKFSRFARYEMIPFLLQELEREFKGELIERGDLIGSQPGTYWKFVDEINLRYQYQSDKQVARPQGGGNPSTHRIYPIYNNDGIAYRESNNFTADLQGEIRLWNHLSLFYRPIVKVFEDEDTKLDLRQGYGKLGAWNLELEVGRDQLWWGPGGHGSLLMTNNARPFDLVKLSNSYPYRIPFLGPLKFNLFVSQLDNDAPSIKDPTLVGMRVDLKPHPIIELGVSYITIFDGEGRKALDFDDYLAVLFGASDKSGTKAESNKQIAIDLSLRWPNMDRVLPLAKSAKLYGEVGAEDHGFLPDRRAYIVGLGFYDLFLLGRMDFKVEYACTSPTNQSTAWYTHGDYPPLFHDRIFGHHVGSNADDIFSRLSFSILKNLVLGVDFDLETQGKREAPTTKSYQTGVDLDIYINQWVSVFGRYIYERFEDRDPIAGGTKNHHLGGAEVRIKF